MELKRTEEETKGAFELFEGEKKLGEVTYSRAGESMIILDHTDVDPAFKGQGIGRTIIMELVDYARENGIKILPLCPFAASVFQKEESIRDVLK